MAKKISISLLILAVIGYGYTCWSLSDRVVFPNSSMEKTKSTIEKYWGTSYESIMAEMPDYETFKVKTADGLFLSGKYFSTSDSSQCAIVFAHGWGALWADMLKYVPVFEACNCDFVMYDHRAHGESEGTYATGGIKESRDLWLVSQWIERNKGFGFDEIGWIGSSWGAAAALIAGSEKKDIGFIIADSPYQDWNSAVFERAIRDYGSGIELLAAGVMQAVSLRSGVNHKEASPKNKVADVAEPILLIHSMGDLQTSSSQSVNISKNMNPKNSWFFHTDWGNDHVMDVINNTDEYTELVHDFLFKEAPQFLREPSKFPYSSDN